MRYKTLPSGAFLIFMLLIFSPQHSDAQERIYRYPDVSDSLIVFSFADDLWLVPLEGGRAVRLSTPSGSVMFPRFSPDGRSVAFSANYDGNIDVYVMDVAGGIPERLTFHGMSDYVVEWYPDGEHILISSARSSGKQRYNQFYQISSRAGEPSLAEKLPMEHAEFGSFSPDGEKIAFTFRSRLFRTWKRYEGGMTADIFIFDLNSFESKNITNSAHNDELPMWHEDKIYYLSDRGEAKRNNIWQYNPEAEEHRQITFFTDQDIHFPALGPGHIVFEAGGQIYLLDLKTHEYRTVEITITDDFRASRPRLKNVKTYLQSLSSSPDGKRVLAEARGEIFDLPAEKGVVRNLTGTSGVAERYPSTSPDGAKAVWWSDETGEYQMFLYDFKKKTKEQLTDFESGYNYQIHWSPDSKKVSFIRQDMRIYWMDIAEKEVHEIDQGKFMFQGSLADFTMSWSPDSRYVTYDRDLSNRQNAIFIYDTKEKERHQVSSGFYNSTRPSFSDDGKYIVMETDQRFAPQYSHFENTWIYSNSSQLALLPLSKTTKSPFLAENDTVTVSSSGEKEKDESEDQNEKKKEEDGKKDTEKTVIDFTDAEQRMIILPLSPGNVGHPRLVKNRVYFLRRPVHGESGKTPELQYYDLEKKEVKTVISDIQFYEFTADHSKVLTGSFEKAGFVKPEEGQSLSEEIPLDEMQMRLNPKEEWRQIFEDAWRIERDFFYDPGMHGVDWDEMKSRYGLLIDNAWSRNDVNYILGELIGELNASHTYRGGGDMEDEPSVAVGYLGVDWALNGGTYQIEKIIRPASWDTEIRSPLDAPGLDVKEGDYVLRVNGTLFNSYSSPYAAFEGLAGKTVELEVSKDRNGKDSRTIIVKTLDSETRLRNLAWIEKNRKYVEEASGGKIGYVYVPSTGLDGQKELVRMFYAQIDKEGLIIDERFNDGGQIPDRFIELLDRPALAYWAVRDGETWQWPPSAHFGPKAMLINGWSGSGGDAFPDYFRKAELGPLIGTTTWGGLIGISGTPTLIDGGNVTAPTFRMFNPDQTWFPEGRGVVPDIEVPEDPSALARGEDLQLKAAVENVLEQLRAQPAGTPQPPAMEIR